MCASSLFYLISKRGSLDSTSDAALRRVATPITSTATSACQEVRFQWIPASSLDTEHSIMRVLQPELDGEETCVEEEKKKKCEEEEKKSESHASVAAAAPNAPTVLITDIGGNGMWGLGVSAIVEE